MTIAGTPARLVGTRERRDRRMAGGMSVSIVTIAALVAAATACGPGDVDADTRGEEIFANNCAVCHGGEGRGMPTGPPLVHPVYVPEQTSDDDFVAAMQDGVSEQHFTFGDMPAVSGLTEAEMAAVIDHVRGLQRDAGLID